MSDNKPIRVGSIIRLESVASKGEAGGAGFLYTLGWVTDIPVITLFHDPQIRTLVTTYLDENPAKVEDRWQILSADPKRQIGEELRSGDKIYLLNMRPGAGYLDTFEWIQNLKPFAMYRNQMTIGVFTSSTPNRDGGVSGTWTIYTDPQETNQSVHQYTAKTIHVNDTVYLKNEYPGAGFLFACAANGESAYKHTYKENAQEIQLFNDEKYKNASKFVFTGRNGDDSASNTWRITSIDVVESLYRIENQWGSDARAPWHDVGIFQIGDAQKGRLVTLQLSLPDTQAEQLTHQIALIGHVTFEKDPVSYNLTATPGGYPTTYTVVLTPKLPSTEQPKLDPQAWVLGSREFQTLTSLEIKQNDTGALEGRIQYEGEQPIRLRATQAAENDNEILYDFFHPDVLKGRTQRMQGVIDTTYGLLADAMKKFGEIETNSCSQALVNVDFDFQKAQLENLQLVNAMLNAFYIYKLLYLMKQSFKNHRTDQTLAPLDLVRQSFQQMATDYEIIQRATIQRQWSLGLDATKGYFMSEQAMDLLIIDKLAIASIEPFKNLLTTNNIAIISYLSEETHIRHLPYNDQAILIGVSYDSVPQEGSLFDDKAVFERPFHAFELMAIPHEIGHYIYGHGKLPDGRTFLDVAKQFNGTNPYYRWCEELFADLYGCIVTGPLTILSMRALLVSTNREQVWQDDEVHPTPMLRVFILNEMLRILKDIRPDKYDFSSVIDALDEDWAGILESWGYAQVRQADAKRESKRPARIYLHDTSAIHLEQIMNIDRVINAIRPIIVEFASHLYAHLAEQAYAQNLPWVEHEATESARLLGDERNRQSDTLNRCNQTMIEKTSRSFGGAKASGRTQLAIEIDRSKPDMTDPKNPKKSFLPDELLQSYLLAWGDKGPHGWGGH